MENSSVCKPVRLLTFIALNQQISKTKPSNELYILRMCDSMSCNLIVFKAFVRSALLSINELRKTIIYFQTKGKD